MFFDRPDSGELAVLVHLELSQANLTHDPQEFEELVLSAGGDPIDMLTGQRAMPTAKYFIGTGKLDELLALVQGHGAELVIFNHDLSPSQERNLEQVLKCRVLDRTGLILDIFAQRARTHEGKLQVELAQLHHMSTRLVRGWTHLERQKGGIGLRGPGETQLETDRRLLRGRIKAIGKRLEKVRKQRAQGRRARSRAEIATVSLVGYTNTGKSTLFNRLTSSAVYAEDQLFATLDPTMRRVELPDVGAAVLADTVGFISNLPHRLVEAFRATLEEAAKADLLLHVVDSAQVDKLEHIEQVALVLREIDAHELPQLMVYNKIDLLSDMSPKIDRDKNGKPVSVWVSAQQGQGLDMLRECVAELLGENIQHLRLGLRANMGSLRARLYQAKVVLAERCTAEGKIELDVRLPESELQRMIAAEKLQSGELLIAQIDNQASEDGKIADSA